MEDKAAKFIRARQIDSFQKLHFLLFIYQHPALTGTIKEFASQLYFGDTPIIENIIADLCQAGLLDCVEGRFKLCKDPDVNSCLACLNQRFDDPVARQHLLDQVRHHTTSYLTAGSMP
jgi:hypothetical protein